jgi:hypothetical protein
VRRASKSRDAAVSAILNNTIISDISAPHLKPRTMPSQKDEKYKSAARIAA